MKMDSLPTDDPETNDHNDQIIHAKTKCFCLINELSELLMLPKDMLTDRSIRKEVKNNYATNYMILISLISILYLPLKII